MSLEQKLEQYLHLVHTYHRTLDLVSDVALARLPELIEQAQMYGRVISEVAPDGTVLDLGSGVGLPGVVIAALLPHRDVLLVERRRRRVAFLRIVVSKLGLRRARVVEADIRQLDREKLEILISGDSTSGSREDAAPMRAGGGSLGSPVEVRAGVGSVRVVAAQAVGSLEQVYCLTRHLHAPQVTLLSRKGVQWSAEVDQLAAGVGGAPAVRAARELGDGGSLFAIEMPGGLPCPRSG